MRDMEDEIAARVQAMRDDGERAPQVECEATALAGLLDERRPGMSEAVRASARYQLAALRAAARAEERHRFGSSRRGGDE